LFKRTYLTFCSFSTGFVRSIFIVGGLKTSESYSLFQAALSILLLIALRLVIRGKDVSNTEGKNVIVGVC